MKSFIKLFLSVTILFMILLQFEILRFTDIYFFDGIYLLVASSVIFLILNLKKIPNITLLIVSVFSINFGFFVLVPVSLERSVTVGLLNNLYDSNYTVLTKEDISKEIIKITETENFTNKRIKEQLYTGYFESSEENFVLSETIEIYMKINKVINKIYNFGYDSWTSLHEYSVAFSDKNVAGNSNIFFKIDVIV